jgi:Homeodomain-like domain
VIAWHERYGREGLTGQLADRPRRGRPQTVNRARRSEILATTLSPPPEALGVTDWSSRLLAAELGVRHSTVARVWAEHDLFVVLERQALRRGDFASIEQLVAAIRRFCDGSNQRRQPLRWTKDADQILGRLKGSTSSTATR